MNNFWGETLSGGENIQMLAVYYKHKNLRVGVGAFNPFTDNYKVQSENWNKFASYKTNNYIKESSRMFLVNFFLQLLVRPQFQDSTAEGKQQ